MDITATIEQDVIADSLLDAPIVYQGPSSEGLGGMMTEGDEAEQFEEQPEQAEAWTDPAEEILGELGEFTQQAEQPQAHPEAQEPVSQTPEQIMEGIQALDAVIQQNELNDPAAAKGFAEDFCGAFGIDLYGSGANVEAMGNVMAKSALSAASIYDSLQGDLSQVPAQLVSPEGAKAFAYDFLRSWGVDPRATPVNEVQLAETVLRGTLNFYDTVQRFGGAVNNLDQINDPAAAEWFATNFLAAFGVNTPVDRAMALKLADAGGKYLLSFLPKLQAMQPQSSGRQSRSSRGRQSGRGRGSSRFQTNADIFDNEADEMLSIRDGRL